MLQYSLIFDRVVKIVEKVRVSEEHDNDDVDPKKET